MAGFVSLVVLLLLGGVHIKNTVFILTHNLGFFLAFARAAFQSSQIGNGRVKALNGSRDNLMGATPYLSLSCILRVGCVPLSISILTVRTGEWYLNTHILSEMVSCDTDLCRQAII